MLSSAARNKCLSDLAAITHCLYTNMHTHTQTRVTKTPIRKVVQSTRSLELGECNTRRAQAQARTLPLPFASLTKLGSHCPFTKTKSVKQPRQVTHPRGVPQLHQLTRYLGHLDSYETLALTHIVTDAIACNLQHKW